MRRARPKAGQEGPQAPDPGTQRLWAIRSRGVTGTDARAHAGGPAPDPRPADLSPPSAVTTSPPGETQARGDAGGWGSGSKVCPGPALLPSGPGRHLPPESQTRRPLSRCCEPGRPRLGASAAPSFSSTGPWQHGTEVRPPGACRPPCGPRRREPGKGAGPRGRTNGAAEEGAPRQRGPACAASPFAVPGGLGRTHRPTPDWRERSLSRFWRTPGAS